MNKYIQVDVCRSEKVVGIFPKEDLEVRKDTFGDVKTICTIQGVHII